MAQFFGTEDIKDLTKTSQTTLEWAAGSVLRIGGQAYSVSSALTLDLATDIDTGSVANDTIYYVYAVVVAGVVSLKYSLSSSAPTGFEAYRKIGAFSTDDSAEVTGSSVKDQGRVGDIIQSMLTEEQFIAENGAGWVLADGRSAAGSKYATLIGASVPDLRGQFLRGKDHGRHAIDGNGNPDGDLALGQEQSDRLGSHSHRVWGKTSTGASYNDPLNFPASGITGEQTVGNEGWFNQYIENTGSAETNPRNITVNIFIKIDDIAI